MELNYNNKNVFESSYTIEEIVYILEKHINDKALGSLEIESSYKFDSGVKVANLLLERYSFRNSNFMMIMINVVDEGSGFSKVFLNVKERSQGILSVSWGKKEKIEKEITELLNLR